jgi:hypothetical protein
MKEHRREKINLFFEIFSSHFFPSFSQQENDNIFKLKAIMLNEKCYVLSLSFFSSFLELNSITFITKKMGKEYRINAAAAKAEMNKIKIPFLL